jgi:hypothetical protein
MIVKGILLGYSAEGLIGRKRFFSFFQLTIAGKERTADEIEHDILRRRFGDPRVHFAIVCASTSCPKLRREAYRGERLDSQLDDQTRVFVDDPRRNDIRHHVLRLSMIFNWFESDFDAAAGSVVDFLRRYRPIEGQPRVEYLEYDWSVNAQPNERP